MWLLKSFVFINLNERLKKKTIFVKPTIIYGRVVSKKIPVIHYDVFLHISVSIDHGFL